MHLHVSREIVFICIVQLTQSSCPHSTLRKRAMVDQHIAQIEQHLCATQAPIDHWNSGLSALMPIVCLNRSAQRYNIVSGEIDSFFLNHHRTNITKLMELMYINFITSHPQEHLQENEQVKMK